MMKGGTTHVHQERFMSLCMQTLAYIKETNPVMTIYLTTIVVIMFTHCLPYNPSVLARKHAKLELLRGNLKTIVRGDVNISHFNIPVFQVIH